MKCIVFSELFISVCSILTVTTIHQYQYKHKNFMQVYKDLFNSVLPLIKKIVQINVIIVMFDYGNSQFV
jgi:type II secretory pathway component PulL